MSSMTKRERVFAAIRGDDVDRPPIGFWGHDFIREWSAEGLAEAMLEMVQTYDYDYLKVNPRATYYSEAWGCRYKQLNDPTQGPELEHWVLNEPSDLERIRAVDPASGALGEQLEALRLIGDGLAGDVPFVQTVFSPLSVVGRLAQDRSIIRRWMAEAPNALHGALEAITETLAGYTKLALDAGADGIFFPTTEWGTYDALTDEEYELFGRAYDLRVLKAADGADFNIFHVCRAHNMLDKLIDYPAAVINWDIHAEGNGSLAAVLAKTEMAVMGGVDIWKTLPKGTPAQAREEVERALRDTGGSRFLVGPGCSISPQTPPENIHAAVEAVKAAAV